MREDEKRQLKEEKNRLVVELRTFNEGYQQRAAENNGEPLAEDEAEFARREKELIDLNKRLETEYRTEYAARFNPENVEYYSADGTPESLSEFRKASDVKHYLHGTSITQRDVDEAEVRQAVYSWLIRGREGLDIEEYRVLSKAASGGGFFVPTDMADSIVRALRFLPGGIGVLARTITTTGGETINIPRNLTHGTAAWIAESGSYTPSDETITQGTISAFKAGTKIIVSEELLTDSSFDLSSFIATEFGERIGALAEDAYINGDGTGKPLGLLDAGSALTGSVLPAGQVTTTTYASLAPALLSVPAQYRYGPNVALLVSDSLFVRLLTIVDSTGRPIWAAGMSDGAPDRVLGMPVYTHPNLPAIGANSKSGIVGDFSRGYLIRQVDGVFMQRQNELHSDSGQVGFRAYLRLDGRVQLADALRVVTFAAT
jgi:HK97 family phage major capsid protein